MNKKQRNRKLIAQNNRNRIINRRYTSTIKTLSKFFLNKVKIYQNQANIELQAEIKKQTFELLNNLYSIIDKAVKKDVIHRNTGARKKSKMIKIFSNL